MTTTDSLPNYLDSVPTALPLIDTHTHFDAPVFDNDRVVQAAKAYARGVRHLVLVGYLHRHFERLYQTQQSLTLAQQNNTARSSFSLNPDSDQSASYPQAHIALGLHPFYIEQHSEAHLASMAKMLTTQRPIAIGEIGLDTYTDAMKQPEVFAKQQRFFNAQLDMAVEHQLPVMLHIRKAHAEALAIVKDHDFDAHKLGGIAHSFSGGEQEAKAFVKLGFKLGVTGQVSNPNAKKLRRAIQAAVDSYGLECLVLETDCPDMTPIMCQNTAHNQSALGQSPDDGWDTAAGTNRNVPANLPWVLASLSELLEVDTTTLATQLWQNSCTALQNSFSA